MHKFWWLNPIHNQFNHERVWAEDKQLHSVAAKAYLEYLLSQTRDTEIHCIVEAQIP